jgi:putative Mg2+ transporter-C (MgtC) family protein
MLPEKELIIRLFISFLLGSLIGIERLIRDKQAGWRTYALVCLGATLFTICSISFAEEGRADISRIAASVVSAIGFIGAGVIFSLKEKGVVKGLTTAASLWVTAAIGVSVGLGYLFAGIVTTFLALFILIAVRTIEKKMGYKE